MSSPIHSRSFPENTNPPKATQKRKNIDILQNILLVNELLDFSMQKTLDGLFTSSPGLRQFSIQSIQNTSDQVKKIAMDTSKTAAEIAAAILHSGINLTDAMSSNKMLSDEDISLITSKLAKRPKDSDEQPSTSKETVAILQQSIKTSVIKSVSEAKEEAAKQIAPGKGGETKSLEDQPSLGSPAVLEHALSFIYQNTSSTSSKPTAKFQCPQGHEQKWCEDCLPFKTIIKNSFENIVEPQTWQLRVLQQYCSAKTLAEGLYKSPSILKSLLKGNHLENHQLAILIESCNISDDICFPDQHNPKHQAEFYSSVEKVLSGGIHSHFVQSILSIWQNTNPPHEYIPKVKVALNDNGTFIQSFTSELLAQRVPNIERAYYRHTRDKHKTWFSHKKAFTTKNFANFVGKLAFTTLVHLHASQDRRLLIQTPEGLLPGIDIIRDIFAIIVLSSETWRLFVPGCKASVATKYHKTAFNEEDTRTLHQALQNFARQHHITLPGTHFLAPRVRKT